MSDITKRPDDITDHLVDDWFYAVDANGNRVEVVSKKLAYQAVEEIEKLRKADPFAELQAWLDENKRRSVQIFRDDGKGASLWTCELSVNNTPVVTAHEWADGDWQGPAFTIRLALQKFSAAMANKPAEVEA